MVSATKSVERKDRQEPPLVPENDLTEIERIFERRRRDRLYLMDGSCRIAASAS